MCFWPGLPLSQIPRFLVPSHRRGQVMNKHPPPSPPDQQNTWLLVPTLMLGWKLSVLTVILFWFIFVLMFGLISCLLLSFHFLSRVSAEFLVKTNDFNFISPSGPRTLTIFFLLHFIRFSPTVIFLLGVNGAFRTDTRADFLFPVMSELRASFNFFVVFTYFLIFVTLLLLHYSFGYIWLTCDVVLIWRD